MAAKVLLRQREAPAFVNRSSATATYLDTAEFPIAKQGMQTAVDEVVEHDVDDDPRVEGLRHVFLRVREAFVGEPENRGAARRRLRLGVERAGPAPVAPRAEELHALHLLVGPVLGHCPRQGFAVLREVLLGDDVAHRVQEPVAGHAGEGSPQDPG